MENINILMDISVISNILMNVVKEHYKLLCHLKHSLVLYAINLGFMCILEK